MYYRVGRRSSGTSGLGFVFTPGWQFAVGAVIGVLGGLYKKLFGCDKPDSVSVDFDPEDRKPRRIYGMTPAETDAEVINKLQQPIMQAYGLTQSDVHNELWSKYIDYFSSHGGGWNIDVNSWTQILVSFLNFVSAKGISPDPRPLLQAHENFGCEIKASCGSGQLKRKSFLPLSTIGNELVAQLGASGGGGGGTSNQASIFSQIKPEYLVLGVLGLLLFLAAGSKKKQGQPQIIYM